MEKLESSECLQPLCQEQVGQSPTRAALRPCPPDARNGDSEKTVLAPSRENEHSQNGSYPAGSSL